MREKEGEREEEGEEERGDLNILKERFCCIRIELGVALIY